MSEGLKIALTALAGVIVFVLGQVVQKWFIEPIQEQRKTIGEIANALIFYANVDEQITSREKIDEAIINIRKLSSSLHQSLVLIPCYRLLASLRLVPSEERILSAASNLIAMSNKVRRGDTSSQKQKIVASLNIKHLLRD